MAEPPSPRRGGGCTSPAADGGYTARKDRGVLRVMEALRSRVVDVGRSFRNANLVEVRGRPIDLT